MENNRGLWVDTPFGMIDPSRSGAAIGKKLNPARALAAEMSCVHNGLIRSLNSVYNQCINVAEQGTEKDKLDFANYALHCAELLHAHHTFEEETLFPGFNKLAGVPGLMDENVQEHEIFHAGFSAYKKYILEVQGKRVRLHGGRLRTLMDNFMPALYKHLVNEIDTLSAMERYEGVDFKKWFDKEVRRFHRVLIMQFNYNTKMLPLLLCLHDGSFKGGIWKKFPHMPYMLLMVLRRLFMYRNRDWWRFAGCDLYSWPKELPFA